MKILLMLGLVAMPAAAGAMGMHGGMGGQGGMNCGGGGCCPHLAVFLYALLAALGYWVLQHAGKEAKNYVRLTGATLGMALAVIGLLGVLCGVVSHSKKSMKQCCPVETTVTADTPMQVDVKVTKTVKGK